MVLQHILIICWNFNWYCYPSTPHNNTHTIHFLRCIKKLPGLHSSNQKFEHAHTGVFFQQSVIYSCIGSHLLLTIFIKLCRSFYLPLYLSGNFYRSLFAASTPYLNLRQQVQYRIDWGLMNVINKTSLASGGTTEKRIAYLFVAMEWEHNDLQFYVGSVS